MHEQRVVLHNALIHTGGRIASIIIGVATIAIVTRLLGPYGFGVYTTAMSYLQLFGILMDAGLTLALSQLLGSTPAHEHPLLFGNALLLRLGMSIGALVIAIALLPLFRYETLVIESVILGSVMFGLYAFQQLFTIFFQYRRESLTIVVAELVGRVITLLVCLIAVAIKGGVLIVIAAFILGSVATVAILGQQSFRLLSWTLSWRRRIVGNLVATAWPIGLSIAFNLIYFKADTVILSLFYPAEVVGIYGAPYKILEVLIAFPPIMLGLLLPKLSAQWREGNHNAFKQWFQWGWELTMLIGLPLTIGGIMVATPLMEFVAGAAFSASGPLLAILLLATFLIYCSSLFGYTVVAIGKQRQMIVGYALTAIAALTGYFLTIPVFGTWAAAWMTVASELVITILTFMVIRRTRLPSLASPVVGRAALATVVMAGVLAGLGNTAPVLLAIALSACVYIGALIVFNGYSLASIRSLLTRS